MKLLLERWKHATKGSGQVVVLSGEPGIGKTRLLRAVQERLTGKPYMRLECRCSSYTQHSALYQAHAARQPVLLIVEDLHWSDSSA